MTDCNNLPDTLHELLYLALRDLEQIEEDPRYTVNMCCWHTRYAGKCYVCLAGSVMALECNIPKTTTIVMLDGFTQGDAQKFLALDELRLGNILRACELMQIPPPQYAPGRWGSTDNIPSYSVDPDLWWEYMLDILGYLRYHEV